MSVDQLIKGSINKGFRKYFYDECVVGKLAHTQFKNGVAKGDEIDVIMPVTGSMFDYDFGELPDAEKLEASATKVRIDRAKAFHFEVSQKAKEEIEGALRANNKEKLQEYVTQYREDVTKQFASAVDSAFADLYTRAGHYVDDNGEAIAIDATIAKDLFAYMQAKFQRGDKKGHNSWVDGKMVAIIPPEYQFYLGKMDELKYTESGHRKIEKGYIGHLAGWDILVSNNVAQPEDGVFYPLFGIRGGTLAGGVANDMHVESYVPDKKFDTCYKGYGLYGVGAPRVDLLGTAKVSAPLKLK